ncbi:MAG: hypothetical protein LLG04_00935 [Parachlamydia sp.]|nr:hypothetical protein [Parachlamydia sp.]
MEPLAPARPATVFSTAGTPSAEIQKFKAEIIQALKDYIRLSMQGEVKGRTFSNREPGKVDEAFDHLRLLTAKGESIGQEACALPLFQFMTDLTSPRPTFFHLGQHKFLSHLVPFPIDPETRWQSTGSLILNGNYYIANNAVNTLVQWCVQGKGTAELFELFPPIPIFMRLSDMQSDDETIEVQVNLASLMLITTPSLGEIRKIFQAPDSIIQAMPRCAIHDWTLPPGGIAYLQPLEIFFQSRPTLLEQLDNSYFDQFLVETLFFIDARLKLEQTEKGGNLTQFIQQISEQVRARGGMYDFERDLLQQQNLKSEAAQLATALALCIPVLPHQGLNPTDYCGMTQNKWSSPQQIRDQMAPLPLLQSLPKLPLETRLIQQLRNHFQFALKRMPAADRLFYAPDAPRAKGLQGVVRSLENQLWATGERCHPAIQKLLGLLNDPDPFVNASDLNKIFPRAAGDFKLETFQELLGHGCYLEATSFVPFCKTCLGSGDVAPLLSIYDLEPRLQFFRLKASSPNITYEMHHLNCFSSYMLTRTADSPCDASLFQDPDRTERLLRLLATPVKLVAPDMDPAKFPGGIMWINPAKIVYARADKIKLPPFVKERLKMMIDEQAKSNLEEKFKSLKPLDKAELIPYLAGVVLQNLREKSIQDSFDVYLSTIRTQPASSEGLINIGDSCWMNASLQVLKSFLTQFAINQKLEGKSKEFQEAFLDVLTCLTMQIDPLEMREKLDVLRRKLYEANIHPDFDFKGASGENRERILNHSHDPAIFIDTLLEFFKINIPCIQTLTGSNDKESETTVKKEPFKILSVPLGAASLQEAIKQFFDSEYRNDGKLEKAGEKRFPFYRKSIRMETIPDKLIVQVLRFEYQSQLRDVKYLNKALPFQAGDQIDLTPYLHQAGEEKALYRLSSCIHYHPRASHYTAMVKEDGAQENGTWGHFDDSKPKKDVTPSEVHADSAYLLILERVQDETSKPIGG